MKLNKMKELDKIDAEEKVCALSLLGQLKGSVEGVTTLVKQVNKKQKAGELNMSKGISFLHVKNQQFLSYLINLTHLMLQKSQGVSLNSSHSSPDVERMIEIRTVLEKMRPTEQKLKYGIEKLIRIGAGLATSETDPLSLKPNPGKLISKFDEGEGSSSNDKDKEGQDERQQIYKTPKLVPMFYDGDHTVNELKLMERKKKRMVNSEVMKDLYCQYTDGPVEIRDAVGVNRAKENKRERERREYEENYFIRKSLTKKELHADRKIRTVSGLNDITSFPDFSMFGGSDETNLPGSKKSSGSRKRPSSSKKSKGGKKKRKFRK